MGFTIIAVWRDRSGYLALLGGQKMRWLLALIGVLVFAQVLWSFSRGMYLSLFLLSVGILLLLRKRLRDKTVAGGILLFAVVAGMIFITSRSDVMRTLKMTETVSQRRSIDTRLNTWTVTSDIVKVYPWGVGNGNYQIATDRYWKGEKGNEAYASYAMNLVSQLMVEKGWGGLLLYGGTFALLCLSVVRKNERGAWLAWLFLSVYLFREQTFSAFFPSVRVQWLFFTLLAVAQGSVGKEERRARLGAELFLRYLPVVPVVVWLFCLSALLLWKEKRLDNDSFLANAGARDWSTVEQEAKRLDGSAPLLLNRALFYWDQYVETTDERVLELAKAAIGKAKRLNPYDVQLDFYGEMFSSGDLESLARTYPHKLMFCWEVYKQAEKQWDREKSCLLLVDCVLLDPRIMDTGYWKGLSRSDSCFIREVSDELLERIQNAGDANPILLAKMGSVALKLGKPEWADVRLSEALKLLPNLSMAWFNLGVVKELRGESEEALLCKKRGIILGTRTIIPGDGWKRYLYTGLQDGGGGDISQRIGSGYAFRFQAWYGYRLLKEGRLSKW